ncbi:DUF202 domain-containing protein [bacterium]|nr:DUF202 domain-containing protein [bacterium]
MPTDPRVYFAAERTLLAWIRTGISILGVGFLVAKFGLFLRLMGYRGWMIGQQHVSMLLGVAFALIGSGSIAWAACQHHRFASTLPPEERPRVYSVRSSIVIASLLAIMGILLSGYLAVSSQITPPAAKTDGAATAGNLP